MIEPIVLVRDIQTKIEINKLKKAKVKLDLTKKRYDIDTDAINFVKNYWIVNFVMVDINCRLKVAFTNGNSSFFLSIIDLKESIEHENAD